jgi:hypothetical protein
MKVDKVFSSIPATVRIGEASDGPVHCFDDTEGADPRFAIYAAIGAERPLLVLGEPGVGKTQLAEAAAVAQGRLLVPYVVNARTEPRDLLYVFDPVARLAEAQICGNSENGDDVASRLEVANFVAPGPLWWAFDWKSAARQAKRAKTGYMYSAKRWRDAKGALLLIDEIDKAESDLPNALLEAFGSRRFSVLGGETVRQKGIPPLVIVTSNGERDLPDAFTRRCVVLRLRYPCDVGPYPTSAGESGATNEERCQKFSEFLAARGEKIYAESQAISRRVLRLAGRRLARERLLAVENEVRPLPGQAEYLDLIRALVAITNEAWSDPDEHAIVGGISRFGKNRDQFQEALMEQVADLFHRKAKE